MIIVKKTKFTEVSASSDRILKILNCGEYVEKCYLPKDIENIDEFVIEIPKTEMVLYTEEDET